MPGGHLPLAALVDPDVGEADPEIHRVATGIDADPGRAGQHDRVAAILRLHIGRHDGGVDRPAGFHRADQTLLGVEPGRGMGIDEIVGDQLVELGDVLLGHRGHALAVEIDDLLPVACHRSSSSRLNDVQRASSATRNLPPA